MKFNAQNTFYSLLPIFVSIALMTFIIHEYADRDAVGGIIASGVTCFYFGSLFSSYVKFDNKKEVHITIGPKSTEHINKLRVYLELKDNVSVVRMAVAYFDLAMEIVMENEGKIYVRNTDDGSEEDLDPTKFVIPPVEEDDDWCS